MTVSVDPDENTGQGIFRAVPTFPIFPEAAPPKEPTETELIEYLLVSDKASKIILSSTDYKEIVRLAKLIRSADGEVTVFRSLKA